LYFLFQETRKRLQEEERALEDIEETGDLKFGY
jgi:hypothetical protein